MDNNVVVIKTKDDSAKQIISKVISQKTGISILFRKDELELKASIYDDTITEIIRKIIINGMLDKVTIIPENVEYKRTENRVSVVKQQEKVPQPETIKKPKRQKTSAIEEQILLFIDSKGQVTNADIIKEFNLRADRTNKALTKLFKIGKLEKLARGKWKMNKASDHVNTDTSKNDVEKQKINIQETKKEEDEVKDSPYGVFNKKKYENLLNYIMNRSQFTMTQIQEKFPEESEKIEELIGIIKEKYLSDRIGVPEGYKVNIRGRVLYYVLKHPNTSFTMIKMNMKLVSSQEISNAINIAIRNKELESVNKESYRVIKM